MKRYIPILFAVAAVPAFAQTDTMMDPEAESRIGSAFYSDDSQMTLRSSEEISTGWSGLSTEDQTALRTRCEAIGVNFQSDSTDSSGDSGSGVEPTAQADNVGVEAEAPQEPLAESTGNSGAGVEPSAGTDTAGTTAAEPQEPLTESTGAAGSGVEPTAGMGFMADEARLRAVCDSVAGL